VVTGTGVVSAIGTNSDDFWRACLRGESRVSAIPEHWWKYADYKSKLWSTLPEIDFDSLGVTRVDRLQHDMVSLLAIIATREAVQRAGYELSTRDERANTYSLSVPDANAVGVYMGTGSFGAESFLDAHTHQVLTRSKKLLADALAQHDDLNGVIEKLLARLVHAPRYSPFTVPKLMPNAVSASVGIRYSITGPNQTVALACAAGTAAIGAAFRAIRAGLVDVAVTGGTEYWNDYYGAIFKAFDITNTLVRNCEQPDAANRPFDREHSGFLFSQGGAGVLVLEERDAAIRRGAPILAEIIGFAESFDAYSMLSLAPDGEQIERMINATLADAGVGPADIDYINAHGTGTEVNDETECRLLERIFGGRPRINSTKSLLGHTIGASGALEAIVTVCSLRDQTTHASRNLANPIADLNFVRRVEKQALEHALSQSFAFGGHNTALVIRRHDP